MLELGGTQFVEEPGHFSTFLDTLDVSSFVGSREGVVRDVLDLVTRRLRSSGRERRHTFYDSSQTQRAPREHNVFPIHEW